MDRNLVTEVAQQIVSQEILHNWRVYLVVLLLSFLSAAFASFVLPYLKRRGEQFATKADMDNVLEQLERTTQTAKFIESKISIDEWSHKEYRAIRRQKLEELILATSRVDDWMEKQTNWKVYDDKENVEVSPIGAVELLTNLYFPEMDYELRLLKADYLMYTGWLHESEFRIFQARKLGGQDEYVAAVQESTEKYGDIGKRLSSSVDTFAAKGRKVMGEILGQNAGESDGA